MNKKGKKTLGTVFLLISFVLIGAGVYLSIFSSKNVMLKMIVTEFESLYNSNETQTEKFKNVTSGFLEMVSKGQAQKFEINSTIYSNQQNNKYLFEGGVKGLGSDLGSAKIFIDQNKLYFKLSEKDPLQYIEFVDDKDSMFPTVEIEEIKNILKKEVMKNLPDKNFSKSKENVTLNQNNLETEKYQMKVTTLDFYNIISNTFLEIRSNKNIKKINETITNVFTSSKTTDDVFLQEMKTDLLGKNNENSNNIVFEYYIYALKDKIVKHELKMDDVVFIFGKYEKETAIFDYEVIVREGNETPLTLAIVGSKNSSKINAKLDNLILEGEQVLTDTKETLELKAYSNPSKSAELASFNYEKLIGNNKNEISSTINMKVNFGANEYFNISLSNTHVENEEVPAFDVTGATKFDLGGQLSTIPVPINVVTSSALPVVLLTVAPLVSYNVKLLQTVKGQSASISQNL